MENAQTIALARLVEENTRTLQQIQKTLASRTPEKEFQYGQDFTGTREEFSARRVATVPVVNAVSVAIDKIVISSPINHNCFEFRMDLIRTNSSNTILDLLIELSNDGKWSNGTEFVVLRGHNTGGAVAVSSYFDKIYARHRFMRISLLSGTFTGNLPAATGIAMNSLSDFSSGRLPFVTFYGE
jgi:hypothetical protein